MTSFNMVDKAILDYTVSIPIINASLIFMPQPYTYDSHNPFAKNYV